LVGRHKITAGVVCSQSTPCELAKPAPRSISGIPGQAEDETAPAGQHRTADRLAEKAGERRVFVPCRQASLRVSAPLPIRGRRVWEEFPGRLLLTRQRQPPCGASGLVGAPTPDDPRSYSITFTTHPLHQEIRASVGAAARTGGRPRGARGEGGTTGAADLLSAGHSPHPLAWSQAPSSQSCAAAGRP
jgi:hypothetical protein